MNTISNNSCKMTEDNFQKKMKKNRGETKTICFIYFQKRLNGFKKSFKKHSNPIYQNKVYFQI